MEAFRESVTILGIGPKPTPDLSGEIRQIVASSIERTLGTCILFAYKENLWIVSCRHVVENVLQNSLDTYKALTKFVTAEGKIEKFTFVLDQQFLRYHPSDHLDTSYDLAILWIGRKNNIRLPITPIGFYPQYSFLPLVADMELEVFGYPVKSFTPNDIQRVDELLPLTSVTAKFLDGPRTGEKPVNHNKRQLFQFVAEVQRDTDMSGISGGLVVAKHASQFYPIGMITGSGVGRVIDQRDGTQRKVAHITFAHFSSLLQALSKLVG